MNSEDPFVAEEEEGVGQVQQAFTYTTLWEDNFDGGQLDEGSWNIASSRLEQACTSKGNVFNGEVQSYRKPKGSSPNSDNDGANVANCSASDHNLCVQNGELSIVVRRQDAEGCSGSQHPYTSGRINTEGKREFHPWMGSAGVRMEARIRMPSFNAGGVQTGAWPAFWALGHDNKQWPFTGVENNDWPGSGEIDIAEAGSGWDGGTKTLATLHWSTLNQVDWEGENDGWQYITYASTPISNNTYHTYAVEWTPSEIRWLKDGVQFTNSNLYSLTGQDFDKPFFLLLNYAMGGAGGGGSRVADSNFPSNGTNYTAQQRMTIDWVRVSALDGVAHAQTAGEYGRPAAVELRPAHSGKCVDLQGGSTATGDGNNIHQWSCVGANWQRWNVTLDVGDWNGKDSRVPYYDFFTPYHEVRSLHSGKCMEQEGVDNGNVRQWTCETQDNTLWKLIDEGAGRLHFENKLGWHDVLDTAGNPGGTGDGANIGAYDWQAVDDQRFSDSVQANTGACTDGRWAIKLYQHCNYTGYVACLPPGRYDMGQIASRGMVNDDLSSFKLASGRTAKLHQHAWFNGFNTTLTGDQSCLVNQSGGRTDGVTWNDDISSLEVW
jgi:beta-glucanase (GH16 family)